MRGSVHLDGERGSGRSERVGDFRGRPGCGVRFRRPEWYREDATTLLELLKEGKIKPIVAERIPLVEAPRAYENLGRGGVTGKQVLICDEEALTEAKPGADVRVGSERASGAPTSR